jgi:hypothetical protein
MPFLPRIMVSLSSSTSSPAALSLLLFFLFRSLFHCRFGVAPLRLRPRVRLLLIARSDPPASAPRGAIGATDPVLPDLIVTRIVELAKDGVYDIEELSSRTLSSLKSGG